ncbi:MAG: carboxylating nicotinate-nucleotide diphosphorylase [Pirellulales bacterium]
MNKDFRQIEWDEPLAEDWRELIRLAIREDLDRGYDWTTVLLASEAARGKAAVVARQPGVVAGLPAAQQALAEIDQAATFSPIAQDGQAVLAGEVIAHISGSARSLLTAERLILNALGRLCGIATQTRRFVDAVSGTTARIYDTRKTIPGWRRLEKYAVRMGGGHNHRLGLYDAVLIKDNHLALLSQVGVDGLDVPPPTTGQVVQRVRQFLLGLPDNDPRKEMIVEIEVDTLEQLEQVLPAEPDIVLLDNMSPAQLRTAVERRNALAVPVELEASGGVNLASVGEIARTGVERISTGALTHGAIWLDIGLDWADWEKK